MAYEIKLDSPIAPFNIGGKTFEGDISDEHVTAFLQAVAGWKDRWGDDASDEQVGLQAKEALAILFQEENPYDYILEKTGRLAAVLKVIIDIKTQIDLTDVKAMNSAANKYKQYLRK